MRIGVVGYGAGGRYFHAPFIEAADGVELAGVVVRSAEKRAEVRQDYPGLPVFGCLAEMLEAGVDAVTITTPPHTRRDLVLEAIRAGVHVVADKPFGPTAEAARELADAASKAGVVLNVYHNRRRDADILTLASVLASGKLGQLWRVHSIMDQDNVHATLGQRTRDPGLDGPVWGTDGLRLCGHHDACLRSGLHGFCQQTEPFEHPRAARVREQRQLRGNGSRRPGRGLVRRAPAGSGTGHMGY